MSILLVPRAHHRIIAALMLHSFSSVPVGKHSWQFIWVAMNTSERDHSVQSSRSLSRSHTSKFYIHEQLSLTTARTKPRGPRLLTSILPLVRERSTAANGVSNIQSWGSVYQEGIATFPAPVPRSRSKSPEVRCFQHMFDTHHSLVCKSCHSLPKFR